MKAYTHEDLKIMQAWPLERKIQVTQTRILEWYYHYGGISLIFIREGQYGAAGFGAPRIPGSPSSFCGYGA